ncbi:hypothetical protein [Hyella patelloides]|nr:hypothetical protein [Hyella patelloides]
MSIKSYLSLSVASVAVLAGANAVQAAALQGAVGINPPSPTPGGDPTGVIYTGTGQTVGDFTGDASDTRPLTDFDFAPPSGGGVGSVVELNANPVDSRNDFAPFIGQTGSIRDVTALELLDVASGNTIENFINIPGAFSVTLTDVEFPVYTFDGVGTTVAIGARGNFLNLSDGSGDVSDGVGTLSFDFAGLTIAETQALFDEPDEMPDQFNPGTWSSNWVVRDDVIIPPDPNIPTSVSEASNLLGLLIIGLGGATALTYKK